MKYEDIIKCVELLKGGSLNITESNIKEMVYKSEETGDISYSQAKTILKELKNIDYNNIGPARYYRPGINDLLYYYFEDYSETNYEGYDLDKKLERDLILEIVEKVENNKKVTPDISKNYISFLEELMKEYNSERILDALDYLKEYVILNSL